MNNLSKRERGADNVEYSTTRLYCIQPRHDRKEESR